MEAEDLLVQRDEGGQRPWEEEDPDTPGRPERSTKPDCSALVTGVFEVQDGENAAAVGWFDAKTNAVTDSGQVVRVYESDADAKAALADFKSRALKCGSWNDGLKGGGDGWDQSLGTWKVYGFVKSSFAWKVTTGVAGLSGHRATAWYITARYGSVISTVQSVALDDVAKRAQTDVRGFADQAGRLILKAQGY